MRRTCRWIFSIFLVLYVVSLALFAIGALGLFGSERDPLAAVFLVPLGLPWNRLVDLFPQALGPWLAATAPLANLFVIWLICSALGKHRQTRA